MQNIFRLAFWRRLPWESYVSLITVVATASLIWVGHDYTDSRLWWALGILVLFTCGLIAWWNPALDIPMKRKITVGMISLVCGLFIVEHNTFAAIILCFVLSAAVMELFPKRLGSFWILFFGLATILAMFWRESASLSALSSGLAALGGYAFFGISSIALRRATEASAESERLLGELQTAHRQLQTYALHAEELAIAQERNRLAREMHDALGHRLTVAAVQLEGAQRLVHGDPDKALRMVSTVREQVLEGLTELRRTVATLRAPLGVELSLLSALPRLTANFQQATGLIVQLTLPETLPPLSTEVRQALYRAAQELLTNVQRHAQATHVWIKLESPATDMIQLSVADDGIGVPATVQAASFGWRGLRERAEQLNGQLQIDANDPSGTQITFRLPYTLPEPAVAVTTN
ncbi:MAG: sensor histidine kinase [Chloroflexi bacterium]|nr:sensor histidine kinase [Chloroflexota bacterium]